MTDKEIIRQLNDADRSLSPGGIDRALKELLAVANRYHHGNSVAPSILSDEDVAPLEAVHLAFPEAVTLLESIAVTLAGHRRTEAAS